MVNYASKIRLYPTQEQEQQIRKTIGCSRFIYNQMLSERIAVYENLKSDKEKLKLHKYKTEKEYKEIFPFLVDASSRALQQSRIDLEIAYKNFFKRLVKGKRGKDAGFPKFKKKGKVKWSYREPQLIKGKSEAIEIKGNKIKLLKLGYVKFKGLNKHNPDDKIKSVTVEQGRDGKFYASILFESKEPRKNPRKGNNIIGMDLGLKDFVALSSGEIINGVHKRLKSLNQKIDKANKKLSKKTRGSNRYDKQRIKLNRIYKKRTYIQDHFFWSLANKLCSENKAIAIETLNISGMKKNRKLSKAIHQVAWYSFLTKLKQKADEYDTSIYEVGRFFPSSKLCPVCGSVKEALKLSDREYHCDCGYSQDRDISASINLRNEYLKNISAEFADYRRGETIRPKIVNFDLKGSFYETSTNELEKIA